MRLLLSALCALVVAPVTSAEPLEALLARMTRAAPGVNSFSASIKQIDYTAVVDESVESTGSIRLKRTRSGIIGVVEYTSPSPYTAHFTGGSMEKYLPKANLLEVYDYGKYSKSVDQYLSLAFGMSGADLQKAYQVKWLGEESLSGVRTTHIELTPKDKEALKLIAKVELWIPEGQTYAVQQRLTKAGGSDHLTWIYSDAKLNPALPEAAFVFKAPPGVMRRVMK